MKQEKKKENLQNYCIRILGGEVTEIEPEKQLTKNLEKYINLQIQKFQTPNRMKLKETSQDPP